MHLFIKLLTILSKHVLHFFYNNVNHNYTTLYIFSKYVTKSRIFSKNYDILISLFNLRSNKDMCSTIKVSSKE